MRERVIVVTLSVCVSLLILEKAPFSGLKLTSVQDLSPLNVALFENQSIFVAE